MDLSIITVNWNTRQITKDCLTSIYQYTTGIKFEVIVIDNASDDGSAQMIKTHFPDVTLIENKTNKGFATANNQGMTIARGRLYLLLNSDTLLINNSLKTIVEFADHHPEAGLIGCRVLNLDKSLQPTCFMYPDLTNLLITTLYLDRLFKHSKFFGRERMTWWPRNDVREVDVITGCFMLARREAVNEVGLMDGSFFMYGEETDWCYRFFRAGWKVMFTPEVEIIHLGGQSSNRVRPKMILQLKGGILQFIQKNMSAVQYQVSKLIVSFWFLSRLPFWIYHDTTTTKKFLMTKTYGKGVFKSLAGWQALVIR